MIWIRKPILEELNRWAKNSLIEHLGIEFIEVGDHFLRAKMPVEERTMQPHKILHGGASCVLLETIANAAANFCVEEDKICVGLELNINHIKMAHRGFVFAITEPLHLGRTTQIWDVKIHNLQQKLTAAGRLTVAILEKEKTR